MNDKIRSRVQRAAAYFLDNRSTIRQTAQALGQSKSNTYKDLTERLAEIDSNKYQQVRRILDFNNSVKHLRGGRATKKRFKEERTKWH